ncbi:MAG: hypothetical protein EOO56_21325, partial [Hymenobacter sp.]
MHWLFALLGLLAEPAHAQTFPPELATNNIVWTSQSKNAGESMPCGGGDVGLNVWVEHGELYCYVARSGAFDENNTLLKLGRLRVHLSPNPFAGTEFRQELHLENGSVTITGTNGKLRAQATVWVDVFRPIIHLEITGNQPTTAEVNYETWRHADRRTLGKENNQNSYKWAPQGAVTTFRDSVQFEGSGVAFYHQNRPQSVFDVAVQQQGLAAVKTQLFNPLQNLIFGGVLQGRHLAPAGTYSGSYLGTPFKGWKLRSQAPARTHAMVLALHTETTATAQQWQ